MGAHHRKQAWRTRTEMPHETDGGRRLSLTPGGSLTPSDSHLVDAADQHEQPVVIVLVWWRILVDDENLGARAQLQRLQITPTLAKNAPDHAPLDEHVMPDIATSLLRPMDCLAHITHEVAAAGPIVGAPIKLLLPWLRRLWPPLLWSPSEIVRQRRGGGHDWRRGWPRGWKRRQVLAR